MMFAIWSRAAHNVSHVECDDHGDNDASTLAIYIYTDHKTTRHDNKHLLYFVSASIYKNVAWCCPINIFK